MLQYSAALDIPYTVRGMAGPSCFFFCVFLEVSCLETTFHQVAGFFLT